MVQKNAFGGGSSRFTSSYLFRFDSFPTNFNTWNECVNEAGMMFTPSVCNDPVKQVNVFFMDLIQESFHMQPVRLWSIGKENRIKKTNKNSSDWTRADFILEREIDVFSMGASAFGEICIDPFGETVWEAFVLLIKTEAEIKPWRKHNTNVDAFQKHLLFLCSF